MSESAARGTDQAAKLNSEKTKDIRSTNIIAAKGESLPRCLNEIINS